MSNPLRPRKKEQLSISKRPYLGKYKDQYMDQPNKDKSKVFKVSSKLQLVRPKYFNDLSKIQTNRHPTYIETKNVS